MSQINKTEICVVSLWSSKKVSQTMNEFDLTECSRSVILHLTAIDRLMTEGKSDPSDKIKLDFFQGVTASVLLYGGTTWSLVKHLEKNLDRNYTRMLHVVLNKS